MNVISGARHTMNVFASEFTDNLGAIFASLGIALAGLVIGWIMIKLGECCTGAHSSKRWEYDEEMQDWSEHTRRSKNSLARLITMCLAILVATAGLWVAAQTAGFNFWTVVLGYGMLSLIGTYAFGQMMRDIGAFFLLSLTDKIEEGWWIEIVGMGVEGRVVAIHWLWVEVLYENPQTQEVEEAQIPTGFIMMNTIRRKFNEQIRKANLKPRTTTPNNRERVNHRLKNKR